MVTMTTVVSLKGNQTKRKASIVAVENQLSAVMEEVTTRKGRRRIRSERKMEKKEIQKTLENIELSIENRAAHGSGKLFRLDTYTVPKSKSHLGIASSEGMTEDLNVSSINDEVSSGDSKNLTYDVSKDSDKSKHDTYKVELRGAEEIRPVPAPRKRKSLNLGHEKVSSDTDRDIAEIDSDEARVKSGSDTKEPSDSGRKFPKSISYSSDQSGDGLVMIPIPKPRKLSSVSQKANDDSEKAQSTPPKAEFIENSQVKDDDDGKDDKSNVDIDFKEEFVEQEPEPNEPLPSGSLQNEIEIKPKSKKNKKLSISDLIDQKKKKRKSSKMFSSVIKLEKRKVPKISTILKDLKESESQPNKMKEDEDKTDFQIDSPPYQESVQNCNIYVQNKNGFYVMGREAVLRNGNLGLEENGNYNKMGDSTVNTAIFFQKYWSRSMTYFHGVLAGFAFGHAATVTAIMLHYNYEPKGFIDIYSCLSLKIHYIFYTLTTFCIVSCFDRIDIGHMNRKHWETAWKAPSMWIILCIYLISFALTFVNHQTEARFDAYLNGNQTEKEIWNTEVEKDIQVSLLTWYQTIWARDMLALLAWLLIALTKFSDFLYTHLQNMIQYAEVEKEERRQHREPKTKTDYM